MPLTSAPGSWKTNETLRAALVLALLLHICFFSSIWGDRTLLEGSRDQPSVLAQGAWAGHPKPVTFPKMLDTGASAWVSEPFFALTGHFYKDEKTAPLWNPYQAYGSPFAADMQSQPFYPLAIAVSLHPTPRTYSWFVLLRLFIAGLCAFAFARLFVSFVPSLAAAITATFAGYYLLFITMPHLSVETLLPATLLSGEHLLRTPKYGTLVWFSLVVCLVMLGGMPESSLLLLAFSFCYFAVRVATDPLLRNNFLPICKFLVPATIAGLALSAILLLPFREYMTTDYDVHQVSNIGAVAGISHDPRNLSVWTYLFPLLFGPPFSSTLAPGWNGLRNFFGLISLFLFLVALLSTIGRTARQNRTLTILSWFFGGFLVLVVMKRYGIEPVNFIGSLPLFSLVQFTKYDEAISSFCAAVLCSIGLERILQRHVPAWVQAAALAVSFLTIPIVLFSSRSLLNKEVLSAHIDPGFPVWALTLPACLLFCVAITLLCFRVQPSTDAPTSRISVLPILLLTILCAETLLNYLAPVYYGFDNPLPRRAETPYVGAPYLSVLKKKAAFDRVYSENGVLFPNWASAFQLFDIRGLDAMYYRRYFVFLRNFFPPVVRAYGAELEDRFTGEHPPYERLPYAFTVKPDQQDLGFSYALHPAVFEHTCGDGVEFLVEVKDSAGVIHKLFSNYIDPKHNPAQRHWIEGAVDLRPYLGQQIELLLSTNGGPEGNTCNDWAAWSDFHFHGSAPSTPAFKLIYDQEVKIYEYSKPLPRASIYYNAILRSGEKEVLSALADPSLDVFQAVVLDRSGLTSGQLAAIPVTSDRASPVVNAATITSYDSRSVTIAANSPQTGILVLNDSNYPGWDVQIDGHAADLLQANFLFRATVLPPGPHTVHFRYNPRSFRLGARISATTLVVLIATGFLQQRRRPRLP